MENGFSKEDISIGRKILNSRQITMASYTRKFEISFATKSGAKYALMLNSGSSANLIATFAAGNLMRKNDFGGVQCRRRGPPGTVQFNKTPPEETYINRKLTKRRCPIPVKNQKSSQQFAKVPNR